MKKIILAIIAFTTLTAIAIVSCDSAGKPSASTEGFSDEAMNRELRRRGEYLVNIMGCNDCHSPKIMGPHGPVPDSSRLLSGHPADDALPELNREALQSWLLFNPSLTAFAGPWGISFSANLTSDESGIGNWSLEQFSRAIRKGKYKGLENTRSLLPPMPWEMYRNLTDEDLEAVFAYLKSTMPVRNIPPAPIPPGQLAGL